QALDRHALRPQGDRTQAARHRQRDLAEALDRHRRHAAVDGDAGRRHFYLLIDGQETTLDGDVLQFADDDFDAVAGLRRSRRRRPAADAVGGSGGGPAVMRTPWLPRTFTLPSTPKPAASIVMTFGPGGAGGSGGRLKSSTWLAAIEYVPSKKWV